jgi:hypothetical protein
MMVGGLLAAIAVVVVIVVMAGGGSGGGATPAADTPRSAPQGGTAPAAAVPQAGASVSTKLDGRSRAGKTPGRPAPPIAQADLDRAAAHYAAGVAKWNESQAARNKGDTTAYAAALDEAFAALAKQREAIRPYTDWFEEADLEGWAMPAEYDGLQRLLDKWDPTYQKVKKLKQSN